MTLRVTSGDDVGRTLRLGAATALVGSHTKMDLQLSDSQVSRRHAEVQLVADGLRVVDLDSRNGTFVGNRRISRALVGPGDLIRVGRTELIVEAEDEEVDLGALARFGGLTSESPTMQRTFALLGRVAPSDATVLLEGETGVGKELLARAVHEQSARRKGPFVVFDGGAIARELIASELFGHKKGAFTGAVADRVGVFEAADGGTVFLDEIGEVPLGLQPMLLRALESREVRRVGESAPREFDVRIIAATNRDLQAEVGAGRFRSDLFFRLAVVRVRIAALRERREDISHLVRRLLDEMGDARAPSAADLHALHAYDWPGNVRELRNIVEQSLALAADDEPLRIAPPRLERSPASSPDPAAGHESGQSFKEARKHAVDAFERSFVLELLEQHAGNVTHAAQAAGITRNYLHKMMKRHGIVRRVVAAADG
jgi:DNA-binding NtrC family response regulator